jgi:hypothetical protein
LALVALAVVVAGWGMHSEKADAATASCTPWSGATGLQASLDANVCTEVQPGTYIVNAYLVIPDGHTLQGNPAFPRESMVVAAGRPWNGNGYEGVIQGPLPPHTAQATLRHFVVDGAGISTGSAGVSSIILDDLVVKGGRCWGVAIVGPAVTLTNSLVTSNGADPTCPSPPGAGIYVSANQVAYGDYAPIIRNNEVSANVGPGVDIYNVGRGDFRNNKVHDNSGWAAFSLLGSNWTVTGNDFSHTSAGGGQPWIPSCSTGPSGSHPAAIFLCRDTAAGGLTTSSNTISRNTASSFYGILLIGNDEASSSAVPRNNTASANIVTGTVRCADDNKRGGPTANSWSGCNPVYF